MVLGIQLFGALFGIALLYLSFLSFKRKELTIGEWAFWTIASIGFVIISLAPNILDPVVKTLNLSRKMDFFIIIGFMFLIGTMFYTYMTTIKNQKKLEELVRKIAIQEAKKGQK